MLESHFVAQFAVHAYNSLKVYQLIIDSSDIIRTKNGYYQLVVKPMTYHALRSQ